MTIIYIPYDTPETAVYRLEASLAETAKSDINWNGATFQIIRTDLATSVTCWDEYSGAQLLREVIYPALDNKPIKKELKPHV